MKSYLRKGEHLFEEGHLGGLWRVERGMLMLQKTTDDGLTLTRLALPGDFVGLECVCSRPYANSATALMESQLTMLEVSGSFSPFTAVAEGFMQQQQRMQDMANLRTGSVASRLRYLLNLVAIGKGGARYALDRKDLPTLREMSQILDIAVETICRELKSILPATDKATSSRRGSHDVSLGLAA